MALKHQNCRLKVQSYDYNYIKRFTLSVVKQDLGKRELLSVIIRKSALYNRKISEPLMQSGKSKFKA